MDTLIKVGEVARRLNVNPETVYRWLRKRKLQGRRLGRLWRITEEDLAIFIKGNGVAQRGAK